MSSLLVFGKPFAMKLKKAMEAFSRTRAYPPGVYAHQIAKWGQCISSLAINIDEYDLGNPEDLEELHLIFLEWYFSSSSATRTKKLRTLKRDWTNMGNFIQFCQQTKVLPKWDWYKLPNANSHPQEDDYTSTEPGKILGASDIEVDHSYFFSKIVTTHSLAITNSEYLESLKDDLTKNINRIVEACFVDIEEMISDYKEGETLAQNADIDLLRDIPIDAPPESFFVKVNATTSRNGNKHATRYRVNLLSKAHPNGLANSLWWIKTHYAGHIFRENSIKAKRDHIYYKIIQHKASILQKYLGLMTHKKLVPFISLVICLCSEINNVEPVLNIKAKDLNEAGNDLFRIITRKERDKKSKRDLIDNRLRDALLFLKERTAGYRDRMLDNEEVVDLLFIGQKSDCCAAIPGRIRGSSLAGKLFRSYLKTKPQLEDISNATYSMIRSSLATIEYINNGGDWHKTALKLGHSINTSMRHYIPPEVKALVRERKARQHQNEMLLVAAYDKDYCVLDAVDFTTHEEVESFLKNIMRVDEARTDILLQILDKKISGMDTSPVATAPSPKDTAYIPISEIGLAALFRYEECISENEAFSESMLNTPSEITGVAPIFWKDLSKKLKELFDSPSYDFVEHRAIYKKALERMEPLRKSMQFETF
ncbi:hypothetical protein ACFL3K_00355 [Pseudomonadota bacterium]